MFNPKNSKYAAVLKQCNLPEINLAELERLMNEDQELHRLIAHGFSVIESKYHTSLPEGVFNAYLSVVIQIVVYSYSLGLKSTKSREL